MIKAWHITKANIRKHKGAVAALFVIIMIMSAFTSIGLSLILGARKDFLAGADRLNSLHSLFVMTKDQYMPAYEDIIKNDPRVEQYERGEVLNADRMKLNYGGEIDVGVLLLNLDSPISISAPKITKQDLSVPLDAAIYLPVFAEGFGYKTGDRFTVEYRNRPYDLTIAGFFESNELSVTNGMILKFFAPAECYDELARYIGRSVWITARCFNPGDSRQLIKDFESRIDADVNSLFSDGEGILVADWTFIADNVTPIMIIATIILIFTMLIAAIALVVTRFRVANSIESAMHEIGVLKASGYTGGQITACYLIEYGLVALVAALLGIIAAAPAFIFVRRVLMSLTGVTWTLGVNPAAGLLASLGITAVLTAMASHSCHRIKKMTPVDALPVKPRRAAFAGIFFHFIGASVMFIHVWV